MSGSELELLPAGIGLDEAQALVDAAAEAYRVYAALFDADQATVAPEEAQQLSAVAWPPLAAELQETAALFRATDPALARPIARLATGWVARLREVATQDRGDALWDAAVRAVLWARLKDAVEGSTGPLLWGLDTASFLKDLPQRSEGVLASWFLAQGDLERAQRLASESGTSNADIATRFDVAIARGDEASARATLAILRERALTEDELAPLAARECRLVVLSAHNLVLAGDPEGAARQLLEERARASEPSPTIELALGIALRAAGRPGLALIHLAAAASTLPEALLELGRTRMQMGDALSARAFYGAALEAPQARDRAELGLAEVDRVESLPRHAILELERAFPGQRLTGAAAMARAAALADLGQGEQAARILIDASPDPEDRSRWLRELARALRIAGDRKAARGCIDRLRESSIPTFGDLVEEALLAAADGQRRDSGALLCSEPRPLDYFHLTSWSPEEAAQAPETLQALACSLRERGVNVELKLEVQTRRAGFHLGADLRPQTAFAESAAAERLVSTS